MTHLCNEPVVRDDGVAFTVMSLDYAKHDCIISKDALFSLSSTHIRDFGLMEIFQANEAKICGVARRLIAARVKGSPLRLEVRSFQ